MRLRKLALVTLISSLWAVPANADAVSREAYSGLAKALTDEVVIPAYEHFAVETSLLGVTLKAYCGLPTPDGEEAVFQRFHDTMDAWAAAEPIQFGPVMNAPGPARFQFWPDKRGTGQRQLRQALSEEDESLLEPGALDTKSVALADLQALEKVLHDDRDTLAVPGSFRCRYAAAIADHQRELAALMLSGWTGPDGYRRQVVNAADGTEAFFDEREAAGAFLNSIAGTIEIIRLQKLDRPMGLTLEDARPKRAENWRSERSFRNIHQNLETLRRFFTASGGFGDLLRDIGSGEDAARAEALLVEIMADIEGFEHPLSAAVEEQEARPALEEMLAKLRTLQNLVQEHIAADLQLIPGFNATDGD
ncbi:MAG: imelysin family protein [Parvibaculaceae bacterium]